MLPALICGIIGIAASYTTTVFAAQVITYSTVCAHIIATIVFLVRKLLFLFLSFIVLVAVVSLPTLIDETSDSDVEELHKFFQLGESREGLILYTAYCCGQAMAWAITGFFFIKIANKYSKYTEDITRALAIDKQIFSIPNNNSI